MSIAAEKLPLPRRDVIKKKLPRRCRTAMVYKKKLPRRCRTAMVYKKKLPRRCRDATAYKKNLAAMLFEKIFQISLPRMYWTRNIGSRRSGSFSLRMFHL
jgi:hypothetical protein